ncbi:MAG: zinc-binding dehydrogenase [Arthrobacter sp.]|nr:zinc-binding dehydrogenase [Arthrobacter sp.]
MHTMLAGRFHQDSKKFAVEEVPVPVPGPGEILIEVKAAGVCLSDVHLLDGSLVPLFATSYTVTVGHEVAGVIHTLGPDLKRGLTVGTRVTLEAGKICGQCVGCVRRRPCTQMLTAGIDYDGGWAQYTLAHEDMLIPILTTSPSTRTQSSPTRSPPPTPPSSPPPDEAWTSPSTAPACPLSANRPPPYSASTAPSSWSASAPGPSPSPRA